MGKSSNPQPTLLSLASDPYHASSPRSPGLDSRSSTPSLAGPEPACPTALGAIPSPSPLTSSLSSTIPSTCYNADPTSFSSSPYMSFTGNVLVDEETFYDAPEMFEPQPHKPVRTSVLQVVPDPEFDGAAKGRMGVTPRRGGARQTYAPAAVPPSSPVTFMSAPIRGPSRATASPAVLQPSALSLQASLIPEPIAARLVSRSSIRKALLVGINYAHLGLEKRLWYAVRDANRFGTSLAVSGFAPENIRCICDETGSIAPTRAALEENISWLIQDAQDGDILFFMFSGHCVKDYGLLTSDGYYITGEALHRKLVLRVPAGCELHIVFDCCHAASLIPLQYCVGRMLPPSNNTSPPQPEPKTDPRLSTGSTSPSRTEPLIASLDGLPEVDPSPPTPDVTPQMVGLPSFAPPLMSQRRGGVVAAPPPEPTTVPRTVTGQAAGLVASWLGLGKIAETSAALIQGSTSTATVPPSTVGGDLRRGRQVVVEGGHVPDHFEEREEGSFIRPAGNVMVWAGSGEGQQAFEAYGNKRHGIVTNALCSALEACTGNTLSRRDLWRYLVGAIAEENDHRSRRDAKKDVSQRQDPSKRVQHAELWVSQAEPLTSAAVVLDRPVFRAPTPQPVG